jgi:alcohol dehydrogenase
MRRRTLYFAAPGRVEAREEACEAPGPGQVLVRALVSAISAGTEMLVYRGQVPEEMAADETIAALAGRFAYPLKYGYALVGQVAAVGDGVESVWRDRLVFAFHPHESHFVTSTDHLTPIACAPEAAVFLPNLETAVNLLLDGKPLIGEEIVVFGQGVVGLLTTALLARMSPGRLVTVDPLPARRELSRSLGATASLDPTEPDLGGRVLAAFGRERPEPAADLAYELSGSPAALDQAIAVTGYSGRVVIGSWYGRKPVTLDLGGRFHRSKIRLIASQVSRIAPDLSGRWTTARRLRVAHDLLPALTADLPRLITHDFPIERAEDAYRLLDQHPSETLQVLLRY